MCARSGRHSAWGPCQRWPVQGSFRSCVVKAPPVYRGCRRCHQLRKGHPAREDGRMQPIFKRRAHLGTGRARRRLSTHQPHTYSLMCSSHAPGHSRTRRSPPLPPRRSAAGASPGRTPRPPPAPLARTVPRPRRGGRCHSSWARHGRRRTLRQHRRAATNSAGAAISSALLAQRVGSVAKCRKVSEASGSGRVPHHAPRV